MRKEMPMPADVVRPEDLFEGKHIKSTFLKQYGRGEMHDPILRHTVENHLKYVCLGFHGNCQELVDAAQHSHDAPEPEKVRDYKERQLPPGDLD